MIHLKPGLLAAAVALAPCLAAAQDPLSVADVEQATQHKGLKLVVSKAPSVDKQFVTPQGDLVLVLRVDGADLYPTWKQVAGKRMRPLPGVGEDAFVTSGALAFACFRKKTQGVCVTPGYVKGRPTLNETQLIELAKLAATRV